MIPKVIHYCWFGGKPLPSETKKYIDSWKKYCPDYEIKEWNENNFDVYSHPFMKAAYEAKAWAFVSDYARLKIIYENGGIYLDTDVELLRNLDFLLENQCYIGVQQVGHLCNTGLGFGAEKSSPVVQRMMEKYNSVDFDVNRKQELACPSLNNSVIRELGYFDSEEIVNLEHVTILPSNLIDPISPGNSKILTCKETISIHHYSASWESKPQQIKRKIMNVIGQKRINKIKAIVKNIRNCARR